MKRFIACVFIITLAFSATPVTSQAWAAINCNENVLDHTWDWATTLGKSGLEKEKILLQNKAERLKRCAEKAGQQMKKDAEKSSSDAKKKLGL